MAKAWNRKTTEQVVLEIKEKFPNYDCSKVEYINSKTPVIVTCKIHGDFPTYPDNHWIGSGCPDCSEYGFSSNRPALLYVMQCDDLIKVGITNSQIEKRNKAISKSYGKTFEVLKYFEHENGLFISNLETEILQEMKEQYKQPNNKFGGYSECFFDVNVALLLNNIENKIKEFNIV